MARNISRIKKTIYLACEGGDDGTEAKYITKLCDLHYCSYVFVYPKSADPETLVTKAIDFSNKNRGLGKKAELWVVFDDDDHEKVITAFRKKEDFNANLKLGYTPVNIAFNAPTVETWALLCCETKNIPNKKKIAKVSSTKKCLATYIKLDQIKNPVNLVLM